jgi:hypothetical protein
VKARLLACSAVNRRRKKNRFRRPGIPAFSRLRAGRPAVTIEREFPFPTEFPNRNARVGCSPSGTLKSNALDT